MAVTNQPIILPHASWSRKRREEQAVFGFCFGTLDTNVSGGSAVMCCLASCSSPFWWLELCKERPLSVHDAALDLGNLSRVSSSPSGGSQR